MDPSSSSDGDIPHITLVKKGTCKFYNNLFGACVLKRTPKLLISDIYRADYDEETRLFNFNKYKFRLVAILGEVIISQPHKDSFYFEVDDGTAQIRVYGTDLPEISSSHLKLSNYLSESSSLPENNINNAAKHLLFEATRFNRCKAEAVDITSGDVVLFIGNLAQYEERRNIFLSSMYRVEENSGMCRFDWLNACLTSYHDNTSIYNSQWDEKYHIPEDMICFGNSQDFVNKDVIK